MPERRFPPPGLQHPATGTPVKPGSAHALLTLARRFAETPAVRAMVAVLAVAAVAILAAGGAVGVPKIGTRRHYPRTVSGSVSRRPRMRTAIIALAVIALFAAGVLAGHGLMVLIRAMGW